MVTTGSSDPAGAIPSQDSSTLMTAGRHPRLGPHGAHTHGSTSVFSGRPQARACSSSWNMGSVLRTAARPLPGTSTVGRIHVGGRVGSGASSHCRLLQPRAPPSSSGHLPSMLGARPGQGPGVCGGTESGALVRMGSYAASGPEGFPWWSQCGRAAPAHPISRGAHTPS